MNKNAKQRPKFLKVAVPIPAFLFPLSYVYSGDAAVEVGSGVLVPVGRRQITGVVLAISDEPDQDSIKIKEIVGVLGEAAVVSREQIALSEFVARYYHAPIGEVVKLCLPPGKAAQVKCRRGSPTKSTAPRIPQAEFSLSVEQKSAIELILAGEKSAFLLQGITGSGKTEVYLQVARAVLARGQSVLMIVPEIALTPNLFNYLAARLDENIVMLHSGLSPAQRRNAISDLAARKARIAIGARSALFSPLPELGLIVVDEEHDGSLKQDVTPRYHGRDVALWRAHNEGAIALLGSATPSLESKHNVLLGKLHEIRLTKRMSGTASLPLITTIDLRERKLLRTYYSSDVAKSEGQKLCILSEPLKDRLAAVLARGEQAMIFLNRRGYAAFAMCQGCGEIVQCPHCTVSMTYYRAKNLLRCHQCDNLTAVPACCPRCEHEGIVFLGLGTERVEQEIAAVFPDARLARIDRSTASSFSKMKEVLSRMNAREIDILIGTQMIAKGHDFHSVSLVGVVMADTGIGMPDFRASEKTFQLLAQVAGRSGRGNTGGEVIFQTQNPDHPALVCAQNHDVDGFIAGEMKSRKDEFQPPFCRAVLLRLEGPESELVYSAAELVKNELLKFTQLNCIKLDILGPAEAPIARLKKNFRFHLYLRSHDVRSRFLVIGWMQKNKELMKHLRSQRTQLVIDIDPINIM